MCAAARDSALLTEQKMAYRRSYMVQASFAIAGGFYGVVALSAPSSRVSCSVSAWRRRAWESRSTRICVLDRQQSLARDLLEEKLKFAAVDPVALHDEAGQGIVYQLSERAPGDVHTISPGWRASSPIYLEERRARQRPAPQRAKFDQSDLSANGPWQTRFVSANWRWRM